MTPHEKRFRASRRDRASKCQIGETRKDSGSLCYGSAPIGKTFGKRCCLEGPEKISVSPPCEERKWRLAGIVEEVEMTAETRCGCLHYLPVDPDGLGLNPPCKNCGHREEAHVMKNGAGSLERLLPSLCVRPVQALVGRCAECWSVVVRQPMPLTERGVAHDASSNHRRTMEEILNPGRSLQERIRQIQLFV